MNNDNTKISITQKTVLEMTTYYEYVDEDSIKHMVEVCKIHLEMESSHPERFGNEMARLAKYLTENSVVLRDTHVDDLLKTDYCETRCTDPFRLGVRRTLLTIQNYCTPRSPYIVWNEDERIVTLTNIHIQCLERRRKMLRL